MEIKTRYKDGVMIIDIAGAIDADSAVLVETVGQCLREGYCDILCNFEDVAAIDYVGIAALVLMYKEALNNRGRLRFSCIPAHLKNMLAVAGLDRVIEMYAAEDLAVSSFHEDKIIDNIQKMRLRRRFRRLPIDIKIELKDKYERVPQCLQLDIINLSPVGAYIFGCDKFKLKDEITVRFKLGSDPQEFVLDATVVWLPDRQIQPHLYPGMGIAFREIPAQIQEKIFAFIERNASLMPTDE